jgi:hypothetical protein
MLHQDLDFFFDSSVIGFILTQGGLQNLDHFVNGLDLAVWPSWDVISKLIPKVRNGFIT